MDFLKLSLKLKRKNKEIKSSLGHTHIKTIVSSLFQSIKASLQHNLLHFINNTHFFVENKRNV